MAQLNNMETGGNRKTKGVKGRKTLPTKVDMTPMVDLAFLLITFFIFTATMNEQVTMNLVMPKDGPKTPVKETGALTLILGKNDTVYYYQGELTNATDIQTTTTGNIRKIIIAKKEAVEAR
jgi:biopolymer transport protein ExbD